MPRSWSGRLFCEFRLLSPEILNSFLLLQFICKNFAFGFSFLMRICLLLGALIPWLVPVVDCHARLAILSTFAPVPAVHCVASNLAGGAAEDSVLVPPNAGPHDYSFSPADIQKIAKADVLVTNGAGLEKWLQR